MGASSSSTSSTVVQKYESDVEFQCPKVSCLNQTGNVAFKVSGNSQVDTIDLTQSANISSNCQLSTAISDAMKAVNDSKANSSFALGLNMASDKNYTENDVKTALSLKCPVATAANVRGDIIGVIDNSRVGTVNLSQSCDAQANCMSNAVIQAAASATSQTDAEAGGFSTGTIIVFLIIAVVIIVGLVVIAKIIM